MEANDLKCSNMSGVEWNRLDVPDDRVLQDDTPVLENRGPI